MTVIVLASVAMGFGLVGLVHALWPAPEALVARLARLQTRSKPPVPLKFSGGYASVKAAIGNRAAEVVSQHSNVLDKLGPDIEITGRLVADLVFDTILGAVAGGSIAPMAWAAASAVGVHMNVSVPLGLLLGGALGGVVLVYAEFAKSAKNRRRHFVGVVTSYLGLVSMSLAGGMAIEESLVTAASIGDDWALTMIRDELAVGVVRSRAPWDSLGALGRRIGVDDLVSLCRSVKLAGAEGARVRETIAARAESVARREMALAEAEAAMVSERLFMPLMPMLVGFLVLLLYPAISNLAHV